MIPNTPSTKPNYWTAQRVFAAIGLPVAVVGCAVSLSMIVGQPDLTARLMYGAWAIIFVLELAVYLLRLWK